MLRRAKRASVREDGARRILADCGKARVHDEPVTVRPMIFQVRTGARDQIEMRFAGGTEDGHERNGLALELPDPDHAEAQLRSVRFRDDDGIARPQSAEGPEGRWVAGPPVPVPTDACRAS